jgi:hypothetical protein
MLESFNTKNNKINIEAEDIFKWLKTHPNADIKVS